MFRPTRRTARRGQILIFVLGTLTILAIIGITFTSYTSNLAQQRRIEAEAQANSENEFPDVGMDALNQFLRTLLYDDQDSGAGLANSGRGHSVVATKFGRQRGATVAWNGVGTFSENALTAGVNRRLIVNHRMFQNGANYITYDPEYTGERNPLTTAIGAAVGANPPPIYIPKNAAYTYPDIKDLYLASICPATGEVLVPSFHREAAFGSLNPNNPNWRLATPGGKYLTLRPRPEDHVGFPYPMQGPDGRWGDVQNLPGGAPGGFDSIWMDIGAPIVTTKDGRKYKPLVAVLIVDLDGRINLNAHGNKLGAGSAHASGVGIGTWEINPAKALGAAFAGESQALIDARNGVTLNNRSGMNAQSFARLPAGGQLPRYGQVPWIGFNAGNPVQLPGYLGGNLFASDPNYVGGYDWTNPATPSHPALYNPSEWTNTAPTGFTRAFPVADTKLLNLKYAFSPAFYSAMDINQYAQGSLGRGMASLPNPYPPGAATPSRYRLDPAHANRQIVTTISNSLDRIGLMPDQNQAQNLNARLGPVDLNRSLADYRENTALPLSPANVLFGSLAVQNAERDRQQFAMDIFVRLIVATGATGANIDLNTGAITTIPTPNDALRNLAQLAANIVDYIDADDINTRFHWNTNVTTDVVFGVERPRLVLSEAHAEAINDPSDGTFDGTVPTKMAGNPAHVRFWIELFNPTSTPYDVAGTATNLLGNGSVTLKYTGSFNPYQIEVVRSNKGGQPIAAALRDPTNPAFATNVKGDIVGTTPDLIFDFSPADGSPQAVVMPSNGIFAPLSTVVCAANQITFQSGNTAQPEFNPGFPNAINGQAPGGTNSLTYTPTLMSALFGPSPSQLAVDLRNHTVLLRRLANPYLPFDATINPFITVDMMDNVPTADRILRAQGSTTDRPAKMAVGGMGWDPKTGGAPDLRPQSVGKVQPYASWSDPTLAFPASMVVKQEPNPTVAADGIRHTFQRHNATTATPPAAATYTTNGTTGSLNGETLMTPFDWLVHLDRQLFNPLEVLHVTAGKPHQLTQQFITPSATGTDIVRFTGQPPTPSSPFGLGTAAWFANGSTLYRALDLLRIQPYGQGTALGGRIPGRININTIQDKRVWDALFDAQGLNEFQQTFVDQLWNSLIATRTRNMAIKNDPTNQQLRDGAGNVYTVPVPGATVYDMNADNNGAGLAYDRPFLPFGTPTITSPSTFGTTATAFAGGIGLDDTLLRRIPAGAAGQSPFTLPVTASVKHPYQQSEAVRKIMNNVTTVSNTFAVWVTVGYFEVPDRDLNNVAIVNPAPSGVPGVDIVRLGKEYYREAPGDTRHKFFATVDRTNIAMEPNNYLAFLGGNTTVPLQATARPFFTTLEPLYADPPTTPPTHQPTTPAGSTRLYFAAALGGPGFAQVYSDGVAVNITANPGTNTLVIGEGVNREIVTVLSISYTMGTLTTPGYAMVTLTVPLGRNHYPGECVSNVVPGNPGPQLGFNVTDPLYQPVVPLWSRVP